MARVARAMAMARKTAMASNDNNSHNNSGNSDNKDNRYNIGVEDHEYNDNADNN